MFWPAFDVICHSANPPPCPPAKDEIDRLNGLQYRALRAELDYQQGFKEAGVCGKGLRKWRFEGPVKLKLLEAFRQALQPALFQ